MFLNFYIYKTKYAIPYLNRTDTRTQIKKAKICHIQKKPFLSFIQNYFVTIYVNL